MTAYLVRLGERAVWHLARPTGRGYAAACGATLSGASVEVPRRREWAKRWQLERVCSRCKRRGDVARTDAELFAR